MNNQPKPHSKQETQRSAESEAIFRRMVVAVRRTLTSGGIAPPIGGVMWVLEYELPNAGMMERRQFAIDVIEEAKRQGPMPPRPPRASRDA